MKTRARKKADLQALTEQFQNSKSAMLLSFTKLTVEKDQQFRNELRETGAKYSVVKNTLARLAVEGTTFEDAREHFKGVTSVAWTDGEPVDLSKVISKYVKAEKDIFEFKTGVVEGRVVSFSDVETIASLPSKEELIGKLLYLLNAPAQRFATALSAIPRDLALVVKAVSEREGDAPAAAETDVAAVEEVKAEEPAETPEAAAEEADASEAKEEPAETEADGDAVESSDAEKESEPDQGDAEAAADETE